MKTKALKLGESVKNIKEKTNPLEGLVFPFNSLQANCLKTIPLFENDRLIGQPIKA